MDNRSDNIIPLDQLDDFQVAEGDPDVRGWDVLSADGRRIGEVDNLLVDTHAMKVRYLDVDIDDDLLVDETDRHILIPIGYARLDEKDDQIFVDALDSTNLRQIPAYRHDALTRDYEAGLRRHFDSGYAPATTSTEAGFYADDLYSDERFYGSRRMAGGTRRAPSDELL